MSDFIKNMEILNILQEGSRRKEESKQTPEATKAVEITPVVVPKAKPGTIGLNGIMLTKTGELTRTKYFEMLQVDDERYKDIVFTEEEAKKVSATLRHLSTGLNASVPLICGGSICPFAASCVYMEIGKPPLGRQCQPPGTNILTANRGYVEIQDLDHQEDKLVNFGSSDGGTKRCKWRGNAFKVESRQYSGDMIRVDTGSESYECTDNHICFAKWNEESKDLFIVYMMQSESKFRIGKTSLFKVSKRGKVHSGLLGRVRKEGAKKAWILGYYKTNTEALFAEEYFSCTWGIPKACFAASNMQKTKWNGLYKWATQEQLDRHFDNFSKPICEIDGLLRTLGLRYKYPIVYRDGTISRSRDFSISKMFEIEACNLVSSIMDVPVIDLDSDTRQERVHGYKRILVSRRDYSGVVYSLGVDKYPTYISNGIITHNCLPEKQLILFWTEQYMDEFSVEMSNFTEVHLVGELVEYNIMEMRATKHLAEKYPTMLQEVTTNVTQMGDEIVNEEIARVFELKERIKKGRMKVLEALSATRKEKAKLNIDKGNNSSTADQLADIRKKLEQYKNDVDSLDPIDAEVIEE